MDPFDNGLCLKRSFATSMHITAPLDRRTHRRTSRQRMDMCLEAGEGGLVFHAFVIAIED